MIVQNGLVTVFEPTESCSQLPEKNRTWRGGDWGFSGVTFVKMASRPTLHEDLTSAFIRYRDGQGQYDPLLDRKKC